MNKLHQIKKKIEEYYYFNTRFVFLIKYEELKNNHEAYCKELEERINEVQNLSRLNSTTQQQVLETKISDLEKKLSDQITQTESIRTERSRLEIEQAQLVREHRLTTMKNEIEIKHLTERIGSSNVAFMDDKRIQDLTSRNEKLENKLEILESSLEKSKALVSQVRKSQQDTINHYEILLSNLRQKTLDNQKVFDQEISILQDRLRSKDEQVSRLYSRNTFKSDHENSALHEKIVQTLRLENASLTSDIYQLRKTLTPEMRQFDELNIKLRQMEQISREKEGAVEARLHGIEVSASNQVEQVKRNYEELLRERDSEVERFRREVQGLIQLASKIRSKD